MRLYLIGVRKLVVEMDAAYIKGMINNPDLQPNATINRWIAGILLFDFEIRHIPAADFKCTDGLSRRPPAPEDPPPDEGYEEWIDDTYGFYIKNPVTTYCTDLRVRNQAKRLPLSPGNAQATLGSIGYLERSNRKRRERNGDSDFPKMTDIALTLFPSSEKANPKDARLDDVKSFLIGQKRPDQLDDRGYAALIRYAANFFARDGRLWKKVRNGRHQVVIEPERRWNLVKQAHDDLGHKRVYSVRIRLLE
ncbi:hypothetical protein ACEPAF_1596 [Sanghuangporus sanghuang]